MHHKVYKRNLEPWEYPLSDCITLCKGCHALENNLVEPQTGWSLISINDLGGLHGICERRGCGTEIRYEHEAYHPDWGYKCVGSSCIEFLTKEDKWLSKKVLKVYNRVSRFVDNSEWEVGYTKNRIRFIGTKFKHHILRIYGKENSYSIQVAIKIKGVKQHKWNPNFFKIKNKNISQTKELAYLLIRGLTTDKEDEKEILRNVYKRAIRS